MYKCMALAAQKAQDFNMRSRFLAGTRVTHSLNTLITSRRNCFCQPIRSFLESKASSSSTKHAPLHQSCCHTWPQRWFHSVSTSENQSLRGCRCFSSSFNADAGSMGITAGSLKKKTKVRTFYVCEHCGESYGQWWGKCNSCKMQGTLRKITQRLEEGGGAGLRAAEGANIGLFPQDHSAPLAQQPSESAQNSSRSSKPLLGKSWLRVGSILGPQRLTDVLKGITTSQWRMPLVGGTGMEIARVLGGGLVPGSLILLGGDPGVGKSTLLLQLCSILADGCEFYEPAPVLYVSGEESEEQISSRADRLNLSSEDLFLYSATDLELILREIQQLRPRAVVIDSIQTIYLPEAVGSAGSVVQVRECAAALLRIAKRNQLPIFLVGHVTRSGDIAGPRVLEHIVDVVLYLEGENGLSHRILRVVKNRFGSTDEVGVFEMVENGLAVVENPSQLFLSQREEESGGPVSGAIAVTMEGSRPFLVEIQALCTGSTSHFIKHSVNGLDPQRLHMILAVLSKLAGVKVEHQNVLINIVGGLQVREPAVDLAVAVSICSSYLDRQIPHDMAFIGEIGLGGEIRPVKQLDKRISEVSKLGFKRCIIPKAAEKAVRVSLVESVKLVHCATIQEVIQKIVDTFSPV
ncbi:hypothetical protein GOP47_0013546 [Adiantum capillus-veneris]|uniref:RecA family profile 1 domain-containing protein n=1 Tax=Adiantum capillus-veneris TaxID=13818 RepID=A0A9D4UNQ8_ADICA|nr:hypothetical protein GOP47_0013546 [Adiantum capillus-veneris]